MKIFILSLGIVTGMCSLIHAAGAHPLLKHIWEIFHQRDLLSQSSQHLLANTFIFSVPKDGGVITCAFSNKKGWWSCFHNVLWLILARWLVSHYHSLLGSVTVNIPILQLKKQKTGKRYKATEPLWLTIKESHTVYVYHIVFPGNEPLIGYLIPRGQFWNHIT